MHTSMCEHTNARTNHGVCAQAQGCTCQPHTYVHVCAQITLRLSAAAAPCGPHGLLLPQPPTAAPGPGRPSVHSSPFCTWGLIGPLGLSGRPPLRPFPDPCSPGRRPGHVLTQAPGICVLWVLPPPRESPMSALVGSWHRTPGILRVCRVGRATAICPPEAKLEPDPPPEAQGAHCGRGGCSLGVSPGPAHPRQSCRGVALCQALGTRIRHPCERWMLKEIPTIG